MELTRLRSQLKAEDQFAHKIPKDGVEVAF